MFDGVFKTQYNLDELRDAGLDPCDKLDPPSDIADVNQRTNVIAYTPSTYNTIARPGQDIGSDHKGATVINSFCNRSGGSSFNWSGQVVGVEFTETKPDTFLDFTALQMDELQRAKDELLCNENLVLPDGPAGQLLSDSHCDDLIQPELDQIRLKLQTCHDSARVIQGGSAENCNALFTKIGNLRTRLDFEVTWPAPAAFDPENPDADLFRLLRPNYEGEFKARLDAFEFALNDWYLPSIRATGIGNNPILDTIGDQTMVEGDVDFEILLSATDPDGDTMILSAPGLPDFCELTTDARNISGAGSIICNPESEPDPGDAGTYTTTVTVTDEGGLTDSETFLIEVEAAPPP